MRLLLHAPPVQTVLSAGKSVQPRGRGSESFRSSPRELRLKPRCFAQRIALRWNTGSAGSCRVQAASPADGVAPENSEAVAREQILEKAKAESASAIDAEQEPFRGSVESGQTIGEATAPLQFEGAGLAKRDADDQIHNTSKQLFNQQSGKCSEEDKRKEDPKAEVSSEVWGSKNDGGSTHAFLDDEKKVDFHGQEDDSVLGIGGRRAE